MINRLFKKKEDQNDKLIRNIEEHDKKEKAKQQESKVLGQKPVKRERNKEKRINMYNSSRL